MMCAVCGKPLVKTNGVWYCNNLRCPRRGLRV